MLCPSFSSLYRFKTSDCYVLSRYVEAATGNESGIFDM